MTPSQPSIASLAARYPSLHRPLTKLLAIATVAGFGAAAIPSAQAYAFEGGNPRWASGTVTFVLSLGGTRTLSDGSTSFDAAAVPALGTWNQYMQSLQLNIVTNDSAPVSDHDGVNSVGFASTFFGDSFGSNTLGITGYYYSGGRFSEANTLLNNHWTWDSYRGGLRSAMDIRRVLIHEIGHALGLDHPDDHGQHVAAVMNSVVSNTDTAVTDDINGIQALYGARTGGGTPTPTPAPTSTPGPTATPTPTPTPSFRTASLSAAPTFLHTGETSTFTVTLSGSSSSPVTVNYVIGGRLRNVSYSLSGTPGRVTIPAGSTSGSFTLTLNNGPRRLKTLTVYLVTGSGYTLSGGGRAVSVTVTR